MCRHHHQVPHAFLLNPQDLENRLGCLLLLDFHTQPSLGTYGPHACADYGPQESDRRGKRQKFSEDLRGQFQNGGHRKLIGRSIIDLLLESVLTLAVLLKP